MLEILVRREQLKLLNVVVVILIVVLVVQSSVIVILYEQLGERRTTKTEYGLGIKQSFLAPYGDFNQPISNDTEFRLKPGYNSSWVMTISSWLTASSSDRVSEAQAAIAPKYSSENLSIPTIIVQERADGLLRVEYFAQNWPNTYGLVLYNSTNPGWRLGENVTLRFIRFGPPSQVNPQLAPRPNGNLTISIGNAVVLSDYPLAWANLGDVYIYGYPGSSFHSGSISLTFYGLEPKK
jgi:hypothetical protein